MQKSAPTTMNVSSDLKKDKDSERNHIFYYKRRSFIKKVLELAKQFDQEIFICLHDKKNNKVLQYSSDTENFSLQHVAKLIATYKKKTDKDVGTLQSLENINDQLNDSSKTSLSDDGLSEATIDTKKDSAFSDQKIETASEKNDQFDVSEKSNEKFTTGFELDKIRSESQSMFSLPNMYSDQRLSSLLSCDELINDQSQPIMHTSNSMFPMCPSPLNKVINMEDTLDNYEDDEVEKVDFMYQEPAFDSMNLENHLSSLRQYSRAGDKVNFAQKYLFKNSNEQDFDQEFSDQSEESEYSDEEENSMAHLSGDAIEGSINDNDLSHPVDTPASIESSKAASDQHDLSENKTVKSQPLETQQDMFFSCSDWQAVYDQKDVQLAKTDRIEALLVPKRSNSENFSDSDEEGIQQLKQCKRKTKQASKEGIAISTPNQFDIDSVMKKVIAPQETEKIISSKSYFSKHKRSDRKRKQILKKIQLKTEESSIVIVPTETKSTEDNLYNDEEVKKCLSPMGSSSNKTFDFSSETVLQKN